MFRALSAPRLPTDRGLRHRLDDPNDLLGRFFHCELDRRFRRRLRLILEGVPPTAPPVPAPAPIPPSPCVRGLGTPTALQRWERMFLALVNGVDETEFERVAVFVGPVIFPVVMDQFTATIVPIALRGGNAITIDANIWFPPCDRHPPSG